MTIALSILSACASMEARASDARRFTVLGSVDQVWEAAIDAFQEMQLPISPPQKDSGVIATDWILLEDPGVFMDCEDGSRANEGRYNLVVRETPAARGTEVTLTASYRAVDGEGVAVRCDSTGEMERRLRERIDNLVQSMQDTR